MIDVIHSEMLNRGRTFGRELVDTVLAAAPDSLSADDAAAHAAVFARAIRDTADRMQDGGLDASFVAVWLEASVAAVRDRLSSNQQSEAV